MRALDYVRELQREDQSSLDLDRREDHIVLSEQQFESHPESGFSLKQSRFSLAGTAENVAITSSDQGTLAEAGSWNAQTQTLTLFPRNPYPPLPNYADGATQRVLDSIPENDADKRRALQILESAQSWEQAAKALDGGDFDLNPRWNEIVAAARPAPKGEAVLTSTFVRTGSREEDRLPFTGFDLEASPNHLKVLGSLGDGPGYGAALEARRTDGTLTVTLSRPEDGLVERVEWNTSEAILHYEKLKKG